jgi:ParB family chromosome partitioning protein
MFDDEPQTLTVTVKSNKLKGSDLIKCSQFDKTGKLQQVKLTQIYENPQHTRHLYTNDSLIALAESIKVNGILQPIVCTTVADGRLQLAIGHRRLRAAILAGLETVAVIVSDGNPNEISIIENTLRDGLTVVEEAEAFHGLQVNFGYKLEEMSRIFGKAISSISEILSVAKLPEVIRNDCRCNPDTPRDILIKISRENTDEKKIQIYEKYKAGLLTREDLKKKPFHSISPKKQDYSFINSFTRKLTKLDEEKMSPAERLKVKLGYEKVIEELLIKVAKLNSYI